MRYLDRIGLSDFEGLIDLFDDGQMVRARAHGHLPLAVHDFVGYVGACILARPDAFDQRLFSIEFLLLGRIAGSIGVVAVQSRERSHRVKITEDSNLLPQSVTVTG